MVSIDLPRSLSQNIWCEPPHGPIGMTTPGLGCDTSMARTMPASTQRSSRVAAVESQIAS